MTIHTRAQVVIGPHVLPLSRAGRWVRRVVAALVAALGALDMTLAAARHVGLGRMATLRSEYSPSLIVGMRYLLLIAGIVCLLNVRPLLHGKRAAWVMTVIAIGCSIFGHRVGLGHMIGLALSGIVVALLVLFRSVFVARSDPRLFRRGWAVLLGGEALVLAYAIGGLYLLDPEFREPVGLGESITDGLRLLFLFPSTVDPTTPHGRFFAESVRMAALGVALVGVGRLLAPVTGTPGQDRDRQDVRALLTDHATTALAHFQLLGDKSWVFSSDRRAFVGYTVVGTTAVALGEPIGHPDARTGAARAFLEHCALSGWTAAFHQVTPAGLAHVRAAGARTLTIGEEAVIDLATWNIDGRRNKSLRSALRRVERAGHRVVELPRPLSDADLSRLREVSDAWLAVDGHRERGFTVGQFDAEQLRETAILAVVDAQDRIQAFANVLPAYRSTEGTFDLMRRRPDSANGVMEFLFVALIERFRAEGRRGMNLGLAPFSGEGDATMPGRVTSLIYQRAGGMFNFVGLRSFKEKWSPRWESRYLAYGSDADLPKVAVAVMRAGELRDPRKPLSKIMRALLRYPFTVAMFGLQLWISVVTMSHPEVHTQLSRHFGIAWQDVSHLQLWRLITSPLIPPTAGFVWINLFLIALGLPWAERRLGTRWTLLVFFGGDLLSTVPVLIGTRIAAAAGSSGAVEHVFQQDSGLSAGAWSLFAAVAWSLPRGRLRRGAVGIVLAILLFMIAFDRHLFDIQHLVSACGVMAIFATIEALGRRRVRGAIVPPAAAQPDSGLDGYSHVSRAPDRVA